VDITYFTTLHPRISHVLPHAHLHFSQTTAVGGAANAYQPALHALRPITVRYVLLGTLCLMDYALIKQQQLVLPIVNHVLDKIA
jgi:hypothetical protein